MRNHDSKCELSLRFDDLFQGGKGPKRTCYCAERQGIHLLGCDDYHRHSAPKCCLSTCWCQPGMNFYPRKK